MIQYTDKYMLLNKSFMNQYLPLKYAVLFPILVYNLEIDGHNWQNYFHNPLMNHHIWYLKFFFLHQKGLKFFKNHSLSLSDKYDSQFRREY